MILFILTGILMGVVFGFALEKARVFEPGMIVGQFQFRNFTMLKMFLSAIITTLIVIGTLYALGIVELHLKAIVLPGVIIGGILFGIGMALTGACPGTVLAQIGAGYKDAWAILFGAIAGAMAYGYLQPSLSSFTKNIGKVTLADKTGISFPIMAYVIAFVLIVGLIKLEKWRPWKEDMGKDYDGNF